MIFYVVELLDDWNVDIPSWKYPRNLESPSVISRLSQRFQDDGNVSRCYSTDHPRVTTPNEDRTDLHVQSLTMTGHIYRDVILEQHVRLFRDAMGAEFLFMDDNAIPHRANIVDECLQS
ncbi:DDE_3 domain-containing protein [Trichonephila clavipes]|uniref:DDE_3 domain-containing protein n=1 Tax=Trichonephila clavipes TaxID=2585209 RepID=A0A8X6VDD6_TRICX|nr:DDE_3 domain-containing protein [Trichonephila clavipes]